MFLSVVLTGSMASCTPRWAAYLLVSPTRSSFVGVALSSQLKELATFPNKELPVGQSLEKALLGCLGEQMALLRPWRSAGLVECNSQKDAEIVANRVAQHSGFQARLSALRCHGTDTEGALALKTGGFNMQRTALDGLTYTSVRLSHPDDSTKTVVTRALVDTGSTLCELKPHFIRMLGLPREGIMPFETAAATTQNSQCYRVCIHVLGRKVVTIVSTAEEDNTDFDAIDEEFALSSNTDDAVLGHDVLAALGFLVDCHTRTLLVAAERQPCDPVEVLSNGGCDLMTEVTIEFANPSDTSRAIEVKALVDTGSTDCDLRGDLVDSLALPLDVFSKTAKFETSASVSTEASLHCAHIRVKDRSAFVLVSPSTVDGDDDVSSSELSSSDDALLGHDALAALGLLVDCRNRQLVSAQEIVEIVA